MIDAVQGAAVVTANVLAPGSGVLVNGAFELAKIAFEISQVLAGVKDKAALIKTQLQSIEDDVQEFQITLETLGRIQNQDQLSPGLQQLILDFHKQVEEYDRVLIKFTKRTMARQLLFRGELVSASTSAKKISDRLEKHMPSQLILDVTLTNQRNRLSADEREKRSLAFLNTPEIKAELSDVNTQKEILATIMSMGRRDEMHGKSSGGDAVIRAMKQKVWAKSSAVVRNEIQNLPCWYVAENEVDTSDKTTLGSGGDGHVFPATFAGQPVAIKIYGSNLTREENAKLRFVRTMDIWQRLQHPNICQFYGACYLSERPFAVMELCDGDSLDVFLSAHESSRLQLALEMLIHAAQGLQRMHSSGIVHCDVKADNILINTVTKQAKVCDFDRSFDWTALKTKRLIGGSAKAAGVEISDAVAWLAPESLRGEVPSSASDVFSFGMTIYQALTGEAPYYHISRQEEVQACILAHELPRRDPQRLSDGAWTLIEQCCSPSPQERPTMDAVLESLKALSVAHKHQQANQPYEIVNQIGVAQFLDWPGLAQFESVCSPWPRSSEASLIGWLLRLLVRL